MDFKISCYDRAHWELRDLRFCERLLLNIEALLDVMDVLLDVMDALLDGK
jgi:hypothetical protein